MPHIEQEHKYLFISLYSQIHLSQNPISNPRNKADAKVHTLILVETKQWNMSLIHQCFSPEEAKLIASIPLTIADREDKLYGLTLPLGFHLVRSAYHLHNTWTCRNFGEASSRVGPRGDIGILFGASILLMGLSHSFGGPVRRYYLLFQI